MLVLFPIGVVLSMAMYSLAELLRRNPLPCLDVCTMDINAVIIAISIPGS